MQARSKVNIAFHLIGYLGGTKNSCEPKPFQMASRGMSKEAYKYSKFKVIIVRSNKVTNKNVA